MDKQSSRNIKLGLFVLAGTAFLIATLFVIGKYKHLLGSYFTLRAQFTHVAGLKEGNNVRYAGIEVGTVKSISIANDTTVEVIMLIKSDMNGVIRKNAIVSLGADGIMGNKVINIVPGPSPNAPLAENNDLLCVEKSVDIDDILKTIAQTGGHVNDISRELKATIARVNASDGLWKLLSDSGMALSLKRSLANIERATGNADEMTVELQQILSDFREGEVMGLMNDTLLTSELHGTLRDLQATASTARHLATELDTTLATLNRNINQGPGTVNLVLNDTAVEGNIRRTLQNVEKGSSYFNENMEAMRHNFLFRGYFKKQEKQKAKQQKDSLAN